MEGYKVVFHRKSAGEDLAPYAEVIEPLVPLAMELSTHENQFAVVPFHSDDRKPDEITPADVFSQEDYENDNVMVVLYDPDNKPVGMCKLVFGTDFPVFLNWFIIVQELRGKGLGSYLMNEVDKYLISIQQPNCSLVYRGMNTTAVRFWNKMGFTPATTVACKTM